ncbi:MAG: PBP1A family penicillin-binding protein [Patescibacteria group bacterium]|nr:PBP1A family penicillin-binding protein [Patescibacteria group bacterium]
MNSSFKRKTTKSSYYRPKTIKTVSSRPPQRNSFNRRNFKKRSLKNKIIKFILSKRFLKNIFILALLLLVTFLIFMAVLSKDLPNPDQLIEREIAQSTVIYDRSGENILYEFHGEEKRTLINLEEIPDHAKQATISIEDKNFYKHRGFSIWAMGRTLITNIIYNRRAGGSTLTQQFVKNALLSSEKKYSRKIKEILIAQRIEKKFTKDEILQMYLNEIPYGSNAYGIEAASQKYFGKSAKDLVIAESALLAALPQAPSRYSPYGANKDLLIGRQKYILDLMEEQGYINQEEKENAKNYELVFKGPETNITAPHFVMYIKEILSEKYGEKTIEQGGLKIYTTIDINKQKFAEEAIKNRAEENTNKFNANNAALVAIDPKNGQILAMVGSKDYFNNEIDGQVNVAIRDRQPGSSLKPLVYATLFTKGYNPNTILYDVITNFSASGTAYEPRNYNNQELGPISIRKALAGSLNIPAVKAIYLAGVNNVINLAQEAGYTTLTDPDRYGLSLVLGGAEVKLLEHVNAYSIFAREGEVNPIAGILKIEDKNGNILEEFKENKRTVLDANIARMINSILSDNEARSFIFGEKNNLTINGRTVAAKTGTTNDFKDAWTVGYTPSLIAGVWVGNNDSKEMNRGADGSVIAAPIWNEFMRKSLEGTPNENFKEPEINKTGKGIIDGELVGRTIKINKENGEIATENTPEELIEEIFLTEHHSILFYVDINDPLGSVPKKPEQDPQFKIWEERVLEWAKEQDKNYNPDLINQAEDLYNPENSPVFEIINIKDQETIKSENLNVNIEASAPRGIYKVEYYINDNLLERKTSYPFNLNTNISFLDNGYYNLKVKVCDDVLNCSEKSVEFNLLLTNSFNNIPANLNLIYPTSGLALNSTDFPLNVQMVSTNPEQIIKIDLMLQKGSEDPVIIKTISPVLNKNIETSWVNPPEKGLYKIYGEFYDWNKNIKKSNQITININ